MNFKHSGNIGDIIYSLPAVRALTPRGETAELYLNTGQKAHYYPGARHPLGNVLLNGQMVNMLKPLLEFQKYIDLCTEFNHQTVDYDLDRFRHLGINYTSGNISRWYFYAFHVSYNLSKPWLKTPKSEIYTDCVVIARSSRYHNPNTDYRFLNDYSNLFFVGIREEFQEMKKQIPVLEFLPVSDFFEMACIINSARLFVGNQSFPFALAEALKVPRILEICPFAPNVIPCGENAYDFHSQAGFEAIIHNLMGKRERQKSGDSITPDAVIALAGNSTLHLEKTQETDGNISQKELELICLLAGLYKPSNIFEFGTFDGRTTLNLALNTTAGCHIYTLDLPQDVATKYELNQYDRKYILGPGSGKHFSDHPAGNRITRLYGDSATFDYSGLGKMDFIFIDGSHAYDYIKNDTNKALEMITKEGIIVWHDYNSPHWPDVTRAINEFRGSDPRFSDFKHIEGTYLAYLTFK